MRALVRDSYGPPEQMRLINLPDPKPKADEVLVRVEVTSLNASDWETLVGNPFYARVWGLFKPRFSIVGSDVVGQVLAVGSRVTRFRVGDWVYGDVMGSFGGLGELLCAKHTALMPVPDGIDHEVAACLLQAGIVALQGLRTGGNVEPGQRILINGAAGSSGSYAVQLAKAWGANVTAVDRADKFDYLRQLGADELIDYTSEDFTEGVQRYDIILDLVAQHPLHEVDRVLVAGGRYVLAGGKMAALLRLLLWGPLLGKVRGKRFSLLAANGRTQDYEELARLARDGRLVTHIDKRYSLTDAAAALRYLGDGNCRGKVIVVPALG